MMSWRQALFLLALAGLVSGLAVRFAGQPDIATLIWIAGVVPALAALDRQGAGYVALPPHMIGRCGRLCEGDRIGKMVAHGTSGGDVCVCS